MNTLQIRSQNQCEVAPKQQQYMPQAVQKPAFQTNYAAANATQPRQQSSTPVYQPSPIVQTPQWSVANASISEQIPRDENPIVSNRSKMEQVNIASETDERNEPQSTFLHRSRKRFSKREINEHKNRQLRKLLAPKNALQVLFELTSSKNCDFKINAHAKIFLAEVLVDNVRYDGRGSSKRAAKIDAAEKALRGLVIRKMVIRPKEPHSSDANDTNDSDGVDMNDADSNSVDVPMKQLACFALYKLYSKWQNEGFIIPDLDTTNRQNKAIPPKTELPANYETMHPSRLLLIMRANTKFVDLGSEGKTPNEVHRFGVTVDGQSFVGNHRTKKLAIKTAAINACNTSFGTNFQQDEIHIAHVNKKRKLT